ncbi:sensor histidine kinase [Zhengella sp. ZM62]|uniref:sensor histidine kinase n=1 Tax=Zhengella sedimenti TaxID=3390035 RepID=UPI003974FB1D
MVVGNKDSVRQSSKSGFGCRHSLFIILAFIAVQFSSFSFIYTCIASETTQIVKLAGPVDPGALVQQVQYRLDPEWKLTVRDVASEAGSRVFQPIEGTSADFGYTKSAIWLRFSVSNETSGTDDWKLFFRENFMQVFEVYQESSDHGIRTLIAQDQHSPFSSRPHPYPELVVPFSLQPGEDARFFIRYWSGGSSELTFSIETAESFDAFSTRRSAKNFIYYGMMLFLSALALVALLATRNAIFLAYAGYSGSALLFIMHADGNGFKYLWPDSPAFNGFATVYFGSGIVIFGALFAQMFLQTKRFHPVIDKLLLATVILTLTLILGALFGDTQTMKKLLVLMAFAGILLFTLAGLVAARKRFREVRFYVLAWAGALISSSIMTGRHWLGIDISEEMQYDSIRIVMVSDATFMGMAIWDRINQLRKASHSALRQSLYHAERNLSISRRMQELEKQYAIALNLVADKDRILADTVHDLRQPLHALRLNVQRLISGDAAARAKSQDIEQTFTYLETLVADQLEQGGSHARPDRAREESEVAGRQLNVNDVLASVHEMFLPDARAKGLRFIHVPTSLESSVEPLVLMRVVSNLVANAINYTDTGKVLLGCRRSADMIRVEVHDTGAGMTPDEWDAALQRNVRLENTARQTAGNGLGLAIVSELAFRHGLSMRLDEKQQEGTGIIVEIPRHRPA